MILEVPPQYWLSLTYYSDKISSYSILEAIEVGSIHIEATKIFTMLLRPYCFSITRGGHNIHFGVRGYNPSSSIRIWLAATTSGLSELVEYIPVYR